MKRLESLSVCILMGRWKVFPNLGIPSKLGSNEEIKKPSEMEGRKVLSKEVLIFNQCFFNTSESFYKECLAGDIGHTDAMGVSKSNSFFINYNYFLSILKKYP